MKLSAFKGLNNVGDPLRLGPGWLTTADNLNITDSGALEARDGYSLARSVSLRGAYATLDATRLYLVTDLAIQTFEGENIVGLSSSAPMCWCEVNGGVYFDNGTDSGVIMPDNAVAPWRNADILNGDGVGFIGDDGNELEVLYSPLPTGTSGIQFWKGRMYAAQYFHKEAQTVIWFSVPMGFHLFNLDSDFFILPGRVHMLAPHDDALIIGTDVNVYAYAGEKLSELANYGVVPGQHWSEDDSGRILFWTTRGLCAALPLVNLTETQISVAPGTRAGGCLVRVGGQKRYLAVLQQGGVPFNAL